jgi:hypothetical protein
MLRNLTTLRHLKLLCVKSWVVLINTNILFLSSFGKSNSMQSSVGSCFTTCKWVTTCLQCCCDADSLSSSVCWSSLLPARMLQQFCLDFTCGLYGNFWMVVSEGTDGHGDAMIPTCLLTWCWYILQRRQQTMWFHCCAVRCPDCTPKIDTNCKPKLRLVCATDTSAVMSDESWVFLCQAKHVR